MARVPERAVVAARFLNRRVLFGAKMINKSSKEFRALFWFAVKLAERGSVA